MNSNEFDNRDEVWEAAFRLYYDAYYAEMLEDAMLNRWQRLDDVTKTLVALTAGGAAVFGWASWENEGFRIWWPILSGITAVLSLIHSAFSVGNRLQDHSENKKRFSSLRIAIDTFRIKMSVDPNFDIDVFMNELIKLREEFSNNTDLLRNDILRTKRLAVAIQIELDEQIKDEFR
ncbi:MAG: hypothetical protein WEA61_05570 [Anaerolineales bacterium]